MGSSPAIGTAAELRDLAEHVRAAAREHGAIGMAQTFRTLDGDVTVDWRDGDYLRITLAGDAPTRTYVLAPDWGAS